MLKLVVSAPGGRKAEIECQATATFGDVKARIELALGVPTVGQKLLCNGKERKNAAETLSSAGVTGKSKLMLMLAPGYQMAPPSTAPAAATGEEGTASTTAGADEASMEADALDLEGELPLPAGVERRSGDCSVIHVRQGRNRYHVKVPQGLSVATYGELADYLVESLLFPPGLPSAELRLIAKGKTAERSQQLADDTAHETSVMLLFREGFHLAAEGTQWLRERSAELTDAEALVEKLGKQIEANFTNEEFHIQLLKVLDLIAMLKHSVEIVQVRSGTLPELARFRERVLKADARSQELKLKNVR